MLSKLMDRTFLRWLDNTVIIDHSFDPCVYFKEPATGNLESYNGQTMIAISGGDGGSVVVVVENHKNIFVDHLWSAHLIL